MNGGRYAVWMLPLVSACFHPSYDHPTCGPSGECPSGWVCRSQLICEAIGEGMGDPSVDAPNSGTGPGGCWSIASPSLNVSACSLGDVANQLKVLNGTSVDIDTDAGTSNVAGIGCTSLTETSTKMCALVAGSITIEVGVTLTAHGSKPLALLGHAIDIEGTIDVASHVGGRQGPGVGSEDINGCNLEVRAKGNGGGAGGSYGTQGGNGGDGGAGGDVPGQAAGSLGVDRLFGGCPGSPSSSAPVDAIGGAGGGAVWISVDGGGVLTIGSKGMVNASGASGQGGMTQDTMRGGSGGGAGGLIVLQAQTMALPASPQIFANGGGGGGGAAEINPGLAGIDPVMGGVGGAGGGPGSPSTGGMPGVGGVGFPAVATLDGKDGGGSTNGGGGGGGGAGVILVDSDTTLQGSMVSPMPIKLTH
jgi:hypothetical protein